MEVSYTWLIHSYRLQVVRSLATAFYERKSFSFPFTRTTRLKPHFVLLFQSEVLEVGQADSQFRTSPRSIAGPILTNAWVFFYPFTISTIFIPIFTFLSQSEVLEADQADSQSRTPLRGGVCWQLFTNLGVFSLLTHQIHSL